MSRLGRLFGGKKSGKEKNEQKNGKTSAGSPNSLTPPPVKGDKRPKPDVQKPSADLIAKTGNPEKNSPKLNGEATKQEKCKGDAKMGRISDAGESYVEALKNHPLENAKDVENLLAEIAAVEEMSAKAKAMAVNRLQEDFPVHSSIPEALTASAQNQKTAASVMAGFKSLFQRKHQLDYERFEQPRTQEQKLDFDKNRE